MTDSDLSEQIQQAAEEPRSASADGVSVSGRNIEELIEADRHLERKSTAARRSLPIRLGKLRPPGAV